MVKNELENLPTRKVKHSSNAVQRLVFVISPRRLIVAFLVSMEFRTVLKEIILSEHNDMSLAVSSSLILVDPPTVLYLNIMLQKISQLRVLSWRKDLVYKRYC